MLGLLGIALASALVLALYIQRGSEAFFYSDASIYQVVARHPFSDRAIPHDVGLAFGNAYRYGRILYPLSSWALVLGHTSWVRGAMVVVNIIAVGAALGVACELCQRAGRSPLAGYLLLLAPGVVASMTIAVTEPMTLALVLLGYLFAVDGRRRSVYVTAALVALTREVAVVALLPLVWRDVRVERRRIVAWVATLAPLLLWWTWVRLRIGTWPPLDPSVARRGAAGPPLLAFVHLVSRGPTNDQWIALALVAGTVALAVAAVVRRPSWPLAPGALAASLLLVFLGSEAVRIPGELVRVTSLPQGLVVLALACGRRPTSR
jgi:hypothetical protein